MATHKVVKGDTLWALAVKAYGDGSRWVEIYNANKNIIKNPNLIYPNQVFVIPPEDPPQPPSPPKLEVQPVIPMPPPKPSHSADLEESSYHFNVNNEANSFNTTGRVSSVKQVKDYSNYKNQEIYKQLPNLEIAVNSGLGINGMVNSFSTPLIDNVHEFNKYRTPSVNVDYFITGYNYIFITKPRLNILESTLVPGDNTGIENVKSDSFFSYLYRHRPEIIKMLTTDSAECNDGFFIKLLTNFATGFETQDSVLTTKDSAETYKGYKFTMPVSTTGSMNGGTFQISFTEIESLYITLLHKAWVDYVDKVRFGIFKPSRFSIDNREVDYMASLYYFALAPDGETLKFWSKYTGVVPISVPYSSFGGEIGHRENARVSVQYAYSFKEDLEPDILKNFNKLSSSSSEVTNISLKEAISHIFAGDPSITPRDNTMPYYEPMADGIGFDVGHYKNAHIVEARNMQNGLLEYKLRWF